MSDSTQPPVVLVDGSSYLFRAFHALPPLTNSKGEPTGAVVGVVNMLKRLLDEYHPQYMAVVFDAPGPTFRDEIYPEYKAQRPPAPEDLVAQIEPLHQVVRALGLPLVMEPGVEADDVIATLAREAQEKGLPVVISSGDKDLAQLVGPDTVLVDTMSNLRLDPPAVEAKFGVPPGRMIDFQALVGDAVDNIPGVPKVGPKTAAKWLAAYGDLDGVMAHADRIKGKAGENLRAALDRLERNRALVTIRRDLPLKVHLDDLRPRPRDPARLREWLERLEARRLLESLAGDTGKSAGADPAPALDAQVILERGAFAAWVERLGTAEAFAFDTETTSIDALRAELVGLSFAVEPGRAAYVPLAHRYPGAPEQLPRDWVLERLGPLLADPRRPKLGQNLKYDMNVMARHGIELRGIAFDTLLESYVLDATATRHDLDSLARRYLGVDTIHYVDVAGKGAKEIGFDQVPIEKAGPYAAEDAEIVLRLHRTLWPRLQAEPALARLLREIEMPLVPVLARMERAGVRIDSAMLALQGEELARRMAEREARAEALAGHPFNLGSPKQIARVLYEELGLEVLARTPKGAPSTAEEVLERLAAKGHELPRVILEYRSLAKLKSTYVDQLPRRVNPETGRVHTSYHQAVAATGRLSSSDPNLQNIPVRTEEGRRIRRAFVAEPGHLLVSADYSQVELRIMAHLSGDEGLVRAFAAGEDIHRATAAEVFGVPLDQVTPDQRRSAKAINFGLIYGMSAFGLGRQLGIDRNQAQAYVDLYFERYPGVRAFMDRIRAQARAQGYVETLYGRRLYLPDIRSRNPQRRAAAERTAINAPMQGTAADIIKRAMIAVDAWLVGEGVPARMILQVHDELVLEVVEERVDEVERRLRSLMEGAAELRVPLVVDLGRGRDWDAAH